MAICLLFFAGDTSQDAASPQCFKVVLLGDPRVGKTSLVKALKNDTKTRDDTEYKPTTGAWVTHYNLTASRRLLITDACGNNEFPPLTNLYLRTLHCVLFVFSLDEPLSLKELPHWYEVFKQSCSGDASKVAKFVVGTKMDAVHGRTEVQGEATCFAKSIGAEMWVTSAHKSFNVHELFTRIADNVNQMPEKELVFGSIDHEDHHTRFSYQSMIDDALIGKGALVKYPDPIRLDTEQEKISELTLSHQCVTMTGQNRTFKWGTWSHELRLACIVYILRVKLF